MAPAMPTRRSICWLVVLALCLAQALAAQCLNDSCLSAIQYAPTGRNVTADCLSFLAQTAPTGTSSRRTATTTVTSTKRVATLTLHRSATVITKTGSTSSTASETENNGNHKLTKVDYDALNGERPGFSHVQALQERRVTTSSTLATLPYYAKNCASEADYYSACSCLRLSQITRAAARPVTTKTVTAIKTIANVTLPPFFANSTIPARKNGTGTGTVTSTIYPGRKSGSGSPLRPTTLFTSRVASSIEANSDSGSTSVISSSAPSATKSTVHVVTIAIPTTKKELLWVNTTSTRSYPAGETAAAPYTNSTAALATAPANITTSSTQLNAPTSAKYPIPINSTVSWYNRTPTSSLLASTSTGVAKTTASVKFPIYKNTTGDRASWYNGTSTSFLPLDPGTGVLLTTNPLTSPTTTTTTTTIARLPFLINTTAIWSNGTAPTISTIQGTGTGTGKLLTNAGYDNTSTSTSTSTPTSRASATTPSSKPPATEDLDLTCSETSTPFLLRVSQPGGTFDKWFVHLVGNGLLFTSSQSQASSFSVEKTGHLCAVGYTDERGRPRIAAVGFDVADTGSGNGTGSGDGDGDGDGDGVGRKGIRGEGPVWMLRQEILKVYSEDYKALECTKGDEGLSCGVGNSTNDAVGSGWVGCGLQLSLGRDIIDVGYGGLNCPAVGLEVVGS
ncbi:hypothetical protein GE21DRAFT_4942 [Neurospora crassa]|uniref:Uncharacterized protein n=1 Tax=Neurospora crassa (strain ATCC 24698 / 74-OR23-1A / CBS 708.71 / DSM 1257 / FGSC 987) TaxID=367110 RepID=Q7S311_NEUCR|nr:hypothetical protein NCU07537 [Neurospora crassa OR74A]EAA29814.1 hypothetical protein NCU07537 [Neurospora crassa OR74A]KHE81718.1 hypothetical protein GE21DRAFT_4942 [Neurospora crassa]|eukprot:XP_959050.1 hypothetical protein NCU07537 [Neurospora crassa OR74A]